VFVASMGRPRSPYSAVLRHRVIRRMLPGFSLSALGDGMAVVAVSWFAIQLAPVDRQEAWVAAAAAAYTLPGAVGALVLDRLLRDRRPDQLAGWDALLRACALGAIPLAYVSGVLGVGLYVTLLAVSSVLHSWGQAGVYTLLARVLPEENHLAGNSLLSTIGAFCTVVGPVAAASLIVWGGAPLVVAIDAATFALLAFTFLVLVRDRSIPAPRKTATPQGSRSWFSAFHRAPELVALLGLSFVLFLLFGSVYVLLPLHVARELGGGAGTLAAFYTAFGIGAVVGGLLSGLLRRAPQWPVVVGIVLAFGAAMLPLGLDVPIPLALASFAVAGLLWPPYASISTTLIQRTTQTERLPQVLAAASAVRVLSVPAGTLLGGPLAAVLGPRSALLAVAVGILALGVIAAVAGLSRARRPSEPGPSVT
jgi:Major Facilitator Superfamily